MKILFQSIAEGNCILDLEARDMGEIIEKTVDFLVRSGSLEAGRRAAVVDGLMERERTVPTTIGHATAVPHFYDDSIEKPVVAFVRLKDAVNLGAPDGIATRYVFLLLGSNNQTAQHLETLSGIARLMSDNVFHFESIYAKDRQGILNAIERHSKRTVLAAPPKPRKVSAGLATSSVPLAGIASDLKRRLPHYGQDFKNGLRFKSIASVIFMFFACLAPAVTFGGLMGAETGGMIDAPKMLMATAVCGVLWALFSGGPLIVLGGIGPMLIFTVILYQLCKENGYADQFLGIYGWVGLWTAVMTLGLALTNAGNWMKYFTRFTDEIFAALMSFIFIYKAIQSIVGEFRGVNPSGNEQGLLALVLAVGTFYIAMTLADFRKSKYLFPWMREFLADFGPSIALAGMIAVAWWIGDADSINTLAVSPGGSSLLQPVDLWNVPGWMIAAAAGPAMLATVLIYLSQNITARLVNNSENRLIGGESYHWDLAVIGGLVGLCSVFGWPWMVAATVRSLAHVRALAVIAEVVRGDSPRDEIIHVNENRVTPLAIHILIGLSLLALPYLNYVPMACLYGIFLYMGFVSLRGIQFVDRLGYWLMDSKLYPINHYTRRVPTRAIHQFTLVQAVCLVTLCFINVSPSKVVQILFPIFVALLVPIRWAMDYFFEADHLAFLDADEVPREDGSYRM
ncbi:MAG: PTS sugar transporter subunit IIA [Planctomycetota bacterium]